MRHKCQIEVLGIFKSIVSTKTYVESIPKVTYLSAVNTCNRGLVLSRHFLYGQQSRALSRIGHFDSGDEAGRGQTTRSLYRAPPRLEQSHIFTFLEPDPQKSHTRRLPQQRGKRKDRTKPTHLICSLAATTTRRIPSVSSFIAKSLLWYHRGHGCNDRICN